MSAPKGVRVTVERRDDDENFCDVARTNHRVFDWVKFCYDGLRKAGVPALRPGESVTGRMVFVPDKKGKR